MASLIATTVPLEELEVMTQRAEDAKAATVAVEEQLSQKAEEQKHQLSRIAHCESEITLLKASLCEAIESSSATAAAAAAKISTLKLLVEERDNRIAQLIEYGLHADDDDDKATIAALVAAADGRMNDDLVNALGIVGNALTLMDDVCPDTPEKDKLLEAKDNELTEVRSALSADMEALHTQLDSAIKAVEHKHDSLARLSSILGEECSQHAQRLTEEHAKVLTLRQSVTDMRDEGRKTMERSWQLLSQEAALTDGHGLVALVQSIRTRQEHLDEQISKKQAQVNDAQGEEVDLRKGFKTLDLKHHKTMEAAARVKHVITEHRIREQTYGATVPWEVRA